MKFKLRSIFMSVMAPVGMWVGGNPTAAFAHAAHTGESMQAFEEENSTHSISADSEALSSIEALLRAAQQAVDENRIEYPDVYQIDKGLYSEGQEESASFPNYKTASQTLTEAQINKRRVRAEARRIQGLYPYFSKRKNASYFYSTCAQMDYTKNQVPQGMKGFWDEMQKMKVSPSAIEKGIAKQIEHMDLFVCKANLKSISAAGVWFNSSEGVLWVDKDHDLKGVRSTIAHEAIHAIQDERSQGYLMRPGDAFVEKLAAEGSAVVFEALIELERMQNDPSYISDYKDTKVMRQISKSYKKERKAGASHKDALQLAGKEGFLTQILNEAWFRYYSNSHLSNELITLENHENMKSYDDVDLMALVKSSGQLTPQFNIFSNLSNVSEIKARFADNIKLNQAFERIELEEVKISKGIEDWEYQAVEFLLDVNENPYLDVDLNDVKLPGDILAQMDDLQRVSRSSKDKTHTFLMGKTQP